MRRLALIGLACILWSGTAPAADAEAELKRKTQSLNEMHERAAALDRELAQSRTRRDRLLEDVEAAERRLDELKAEVEAGKARAGEASAALKKTRAERAAIEHKLSQQQDLLGRQIRAAYMMGRRGTAKLILRQRDTSRLERLLTDFDYLNRARARAVGAIREQRDALRALEDRQRQQTATLADAQAAQERALAAVATARQARLAAVQKLKDRIAGGEAELEELRAGERELATLISRLKDLLAEIPPGFRSGPLAKQKSHLPWPLRGKLLARYGAPKAGGKLKWAGIWIAAPEGAPVRSVASGRIAYVGRLQRFGLLAVIEHTDGYYTLYGHNAEITRAAGDTVRAGDVIGRAGNSGGHEESGVYFELRKGSQAVDPLQWLSR